MQWITLIQFYGLCDQCVSIKGLPKKSTKKAPLRRDPNKQETGLPGQTKMINLK